MAGGQPPLFLSVGALNDFYRFDRTCLGASTTPVALGGVDVHNPIGCDNAGVDAERLQHPHHVATAAAAVADEGDLPLDVVPGLGQAASLHVPRIFIASSFVMGRAVPFRIRLSLA